MNAENGTALKLLEPEQVKQTFEVVRMESTDALGTARDLAAAIKDDSSYEEAATYRKTLKMAKDEALERLEAVRKPTYAAYQEILRLIKEVVAPYDGALAALDQPLISYHNARERLRKEAEDAAAAAAKKLVEDAQVARAAAAEVAGDTEKAAAIMEQPTIVPKVILPAAAKPEGQAIRTTWTAEVVDLKVLLGAIVAGRAPLDTIEPNLPVLNALARASKENLAIPGVRAVPKQGIANR